MKLIITKTIFDLDDTRECKNEYNIILDPKEANELGNIISFYVNNKIDSDYSTAAYELFWNPIYGNLTLKYSIEDYLQFKDFITKVANNPHSPEFAKDFETKIKEVLA